MILKLKMTPGVDLSLPWGYIFMFMTIIVEQVYWCISQISGERLQDHWSSGNLDLHVVLSHRFLSAPIAGIFINKFSSRISIIVGGVLGSTGLACSAFCTTLDGVIITAGVLLGI